MSSDVGVCLMTPPVRTTNTGIRLNSVYFIQPNITNYEFPSQGFTIWTHTTSLTFDLTSDQEQHPKNRKNSGKKSEEPFRREQRRTPLQDGQENRRHVTRRNHYRVT